MVGGKQVYRQLGKVHSQTFIGKKLCQRSDAQGFAGSLLKNVAHLCIRTSLVPKHHVCALLIFNEMRNQDVVGRGVFGVDTGDF